MQNKNVDASMNFTETTTGASLTQVTQKTEDINTVYYNSVGMKKASRPIWKKRQEVLKQMDKIYKAQALLQSTWVDLNKERIAIEEQFFASEKQVATASSGKNGTGFINQQSVNGGVI